MTNRREPLLLFIVDIAFFLAALWLTLLLRYFVLPDINTFYNHLLPFSFLFGSSVVVFFIAGLYDKHAVLFRGKLPRTILNAQTVNIIIAALFFFFIPYFGIAPKTSLGIYLIVSSALILFWRLYLFPRLVTRRQQKALLIGAGEEMEELKKEVNSNPLYPVLFVETIGSAFPLQEFVRSVQERVRKEGIAIVVCDTSDEKIGRALPRLYDLVFHGVRFIDAAQMYEEIFDREPLSLLEHRWLVE